MRSTIHTQLLPTILRLVLCRWSLCFYEAFRTIRKYFLFQCFNTFPLSRTDSFLFFQVADDALIGENLNDSIVYGQFLRHSSTISIIYCIAYSIVFFVGLIGNFFVISVVFRVPRMKSVTNLFIANLALADMLVIIFCVPATLMSNLFVREY